MTSAAAGICRAQHCCNVLNVVVTCLLVVLAHLSAAQNVGFSQAGIAFSGMQSPDDSNSVQITIAAPSGVNWVGLGYGGSRMDGTPMTIIWPVSGSDNTVIISSRVGSGHSTAQASGGYNVASVVSASVSTSDKSWTVTFKHPVDDSVNTAQSSFIWAAGVGGDLFTDTAIDFVPPGYHGGNRGSVSGVGFWQAAPGGGATQAAPPAPQDTSTAAAAATTTTSEAPAPVVVDEPSETQSTSSQSSIFAASTVVAAGLPAFVGKAAPATSGSSCRLLPRGFAAAGPFVLVVACMWGLLL